MVTKNTFKKQFPDIKVQKLESKVVLSHRQVEETVTGMCQSLGMGLVYYERSGKNITVYTSDKMKAALDGMKKGASVLYHEEDVSGTVTSEEPYIMGGELCVTVDFSGTAIGSGAYSCTSFII